MPSDVLWRRASHIMAPDMSSVANVGDGGAMPSLFSFGRTPPPTIVYYALAYVAVMLLVDIWSFRRRDL